jgi:ribosomal protein L19
MKKLFFLIMPFYLFAFAYPDFRPCYKKYAYIKTFIPVNEYESVTFDKKNCFRYDPFTGICVVKHKNRKYIKTFTVPKLGWWGASVKHDEIYVGNFAQKGIFLTPWRLSVKTPKNSVITDMFCRTAGFGTGDGFVGADMVKHFVKYGYWGDAGIEVNENMNIVSFDPFYVKNIKIGEKIEFINGHKASPAEFNRYILEGICGKTVLLVVGGRKIKIKLRKKKYLFTPLEHFGIKVDKKLRITSLPDKLENIYYVMPGAKITAVNGVKVETFEQLKKALSTYKNVTISLEQQGITATIPLR